MFRRINIKDSDENFKATLWKNRREPLCIIDNEYIETVKRSMLDIDYFSLEIPKWITRNEKKVYNPLYLKIQPRQQIVVETTVDGEIKKEKFIITEPSRKGSKHSGSKSFKAYSFEHTLKDKRTSFDGKVVQLKTDDIHIAEGIMDKFSRETGWEIGSVDPKSRTETMSMMEIVNVDIFNEFTSSNIVDGGLIFEKDVTTNISENRPLYISFEYKNLDIYDGNNLLLKIPTVSNTLTDALYKNIIKVQAYHYSDVGNRYGIRYVFTLIDNTTVERIAVFTNIINKKFTCENIRLVWETGNLIETENVKYINIESLDMDWFSALRDLQDKFNSVFLFDSYNKSVSVVSRGTLEEDSNLSPYILSYDNAILDIDVTETSEFVTGLKVLGKDGLSIISENIYGDDIVRDYSEYIRRGIISDELKTALARYEAILTTKQQEWLNIKNSVLDETQKQVRIQSEIKSLQDRIKYLKNLLAGFMKEQDSTNQARIKSEIDGLETRFNQCSALYTQYFNNIQKLTDELGVISQSTSKNNVVDNQGKIFTELDLQELNELEVTKVYEDDYYSSSFALINAAKKILADMIDPQVDFKINCPNLCKIIQNSNGWRYILRLGNLFKVEGVDIFEELVNKQDYSVRLIGYDYEPKDNKISNLIFTNKIEKINVERSLANLGKKNNANTDLLNTYRKIFDDAKLSNNFVKEILDNGLDLSAHIAKGRGISNYIDISEAGIYMYDQSDMDKCIYIGSSLICISNDGFSTSETAISSSGIMAKILVGSVILGEKLHITSENGEFFIGDMDENEGFGLRIKDGDGANKIFLGTELVSGVRKARLRLIGSSGELVLSEDGIMSEIQFNDRDHVDEFAPFKSYYRVGNNVSSFKEVVLNIVLSPFRVYSKGLESGGQLTTEGFTSMSGGGTTSGAGGNYYKASSSGSELYINVGNFITSLDENTTLPGYTERHYHTTNKELFNHSHSTLIDIPVHHHSNPDHSHITNVNVDTRHTHEEKYGCIDLSGDDNNPSDCSLYVNNVLVKDNINSNIEVDIKDYINKNQMNEIKITSKTRGVVHIHIYTKSFILW